MKTEFANFNRLVRFIIFLLNRRTNQMKADTSICESVFKSPLNCSTSKACFSFTKAPRSPQRKSANDLIYDLPSMMNGRATAIGFGKKVDIAPRNSSPPPTQYQKPSEFNASPKKGISFGLSRQDIKAVSIFQQTKSPGPGQYDNTLKLPAKGYQMRGRDGFPKIFQSMHTPGPGQYEIKQQTDKQFYMNSKRKSPQVYSIRKGEKQNQEKLSNIGPGSYQTSFASMGRQILGNKKTEKTFCFDKQARQTFVTPKSKIGPGSYQTFSQFSK